MPQTVSSSVSKIPTAAASVEAIESDREFKAHIYQQLVDLQPYLTPESQVAVLVQVEQDETDDSDVEYALTLVATLGDYKIEAEGRDADLYLAMGAAKRRMIAQLDEIYASAIDSKEREAEIHSLLQGNQTVH